MSKILVVDDEPAIRNLLEILLIREKFEVSSAKNGKEALERLESFCPDLIMLDLMLPDISGHALCKQISQKCKIPIIMLTAKNEVLDKIMGLELGADDYITKPFDSGELLARIRATLRRLGNSNQNENVIIRGNLKIDLTGKMVVKNGIEVSVTLKEYQILEILARNPNKVFSREELLSTVWGYDYLGDSRVVDISITRLRKKIEDKAGTPKFIITVFGFGYRFGGVGI